jgi:hypothetical protein
MRAIVRVTKPWEEVMRVFVGYGYNARDQWIEDAVFPILRALGFEILHGKEMHGDVLQGAVQARINQSQGLIGFCTLRQGHETEAFNTHPWVRDEIVYALGHKPPKPFIEVRENGVKEVKGIVGDRQYIALGEDKLACVAELATAVSRWSMRKLQLVPKTPEDQIRASMQDLRAAMSDPALVVRYWTRINSVDSQPKEEKIDGVKGGIYLDAAGVPDNGLVKVEGSLGGRVVFYTDWESVDAVQLPVLKGGRK